MTFLYRYEDHPSTHPSEPVIILERFPILKRTPKGAWISVWGKKKFVQLERHKQYGCETTELAMESFKARKDRQIRILSAQLTQVKAAREAVDKPGFVAQDYSIRFEE